MFTLFHISETIEVTEKTEDPTTESEEKKEEIDFKEQKKDKDQTSKKIFWNYILWKFQAKKTRENEMNFHEVNLKFLNSYYGKNVQQKNSLKLIFSCLLGLDFLKNFVACCAQK